jgi:prophage regulatory protein
MTKMLKLPEVMALTGLSRSTIYAFIKEKKFPKPVRLGARAVGWLEYEVSSWIKDRADVREA